MHLNTDTLGTVSVSRQLVHTVLHHLIQQMMYFAVWNEKFQISVDFTVLHVATDSNDQHLHSSYMYPPSRDLWLHD